MKGCAGPWPGRLLLAAPLLPTIIPAARFFSRTRWRAHLVHTQPLLEMCGGATITTTAIAAAPAMCAPL